MSTKKREENLGTVTKNRAIKIFEALGFQTADKWDVARLQKKLVKLSTLVDGANLDSKTQKRVNEILRAQKAGRKVAVIDPNDAAADKQREKKVEDAAKREKERKAEKRSKTAKKEKAVVKKKAKEGKAAKKQEKRIAEKVDTDKFGSRKGSNPAKINAVLSKKPKKMSQLIKEAKLSGTHYEHLSKLIEAGHAKKTEKGYALA